MKNLKPYQIAILDPGDKDWEVECISYPYNDIQGELIGIRLIPDDPCSFETVLTNRLSLTPTINEHTRYMYSDLPYSYIEQTKSPDDDWKPGILSSLLKFWK